MTTTTYVSAVRSFDHTPLSRLDGYPALRQALSDLANQAGQVALDEFLAAVRDMTLTAPYADCCARCRETGDGLSEIAWPHAVDRDVNGWLTCRYRCRRGHAWTCGYAVDFPRLGW